VAYAVAEAFHWRGGLSKTFRQAPGFYVVIGTATFVGILLNLLGINPILALVYSAVMNGEVAVPLLVLLLLVALIARSWGRTRMAGSPTAWAS